MMFQAIAPMRPDVTTWIVTVSGLTMPLPIVDATFCSNTRYAMKLKNAAHTTAQWGFITRVDTMVAIEFAASCIPLTKSKTRASAMTAQTTQSSGMSVRHGGWQAASEGL